MSKTVKVSLSSPKSKKALSTNSNTISLGSGECVFPFKYKDTLYTKCYPGKKGDWCATKVNKKKEMKTFAYCDYGDSSNVVNASKVVNTTNVRNNSKSSKKVKANNPLPKNESGKKKRTFKVKFNPNQISNEYLIPEKDNLDIKVWELPNRKTFPEWFNKKYKPYKAIKDSMKTSSKGFDLFNHQKLIRDYLNTNSPYRGILLFHGLGVGKTCASIAIAEGFRSHRNIAIVCFKSLVKNFKVNLMKCGFEMFRLNQHWVFHDFSNSKDPMIPYAKFLGIPQSVITKNNGAWFIDFTKSPNFEDLSGRQQESLNAQIEALINTKYTFYHLDGLTKDKLETMNRTRVFDNKLVIFDEVHNLTNAMSKSYPGIRASGLKELIMEAEDLKLVFLSGTPIINNLYEAGQLFNLLRGYINNYQVTLIKKPSSKHSYDDVLEELTKIDLIDQIIPKKRDNIINIVRNPIGFVSVKSGLIHSDRNNISDDDFKTVLKEICVKLDYNIAIIKNRYTAFPNVEEEFMNLFYNESKNELKNPKLLQSRMIGLASYFSTQNKALLPTVIVDKEELIPMSKYQFLAYSVVRKAELDQDKGKKTTGKVKGKAPKKSNSSKSDSGDLFDDKKSSYRAYSRMHCSFVFPESVPRPYKNNNMTDEKELQEWLKTVELDLKKIFRKDELKIKELKIESFIEGLLQQLTIINSEEDPEKIKELIGLKEIVESKLAELNAKKLELTDVEQDEEVEIDEQFNNIGEKKVSVIGSSAKKINKKYEKDKITTLEKLDAEKHTLFTVDDPEQLLKYSPKYNEIIKRCTAMKGLSFIYTEYKTLEGIAVLEIILKANGYAKFLLDKNDSDEYIQVFEHPDDKDKPKFAFWGGDEEKSDIIRKVYNNQFDLLPTTLRQELERKGKNNIYGDVIKILMTTKSGAEGIDLQNVRQVHVVEPYWNPVRTQQVKGRAVRVGSHLQLPPKDRTVEIYTYLSVIKNEDLKTDLTILDDKGGLSSDQVLYEISQKKKKIMDDFLKMIKETSVDCEINIKETKSPENDFECLEYPTNPTRDDYSFIPNIQNEHVDTERKRRIKLVTTEFSFKKIPIKGEIIQFAVKKSSKIDEPNLLYDAETVKENPKKPGPILGEYMEGSTKFKFTKEFKKKYKHLLI